MRIEMDLNVDRKQYYIYKHYYYTNEKEVVFYIGKGQGNRYLSTNRNALWKDIVYNQLKGKYYIEIIEYYSNESDCLKRERELQEYYYSIGQCQGCKDVLDRHEGPKPQNSNKNKKRFTIYASYMEDEEYIYIPVRWDKTCLYKRILTPYKYTDFTIGDIIYTIIKLPISDFDYELISTSTSQNQTLRIIDKVSPTRWISVALKNRTIQPIEFNDEKNIYITQKDIEFYLNM